MVGCHLGQPLSQALEDKWIDMFGKKFQENVIIKWCVCVRAHVPVTAVM